MFAADSSIIYNCTIKNNRSYKGGGGITIEERILIDKCLIENNRAKNTAGIFVSNGSHFITNCRITSNKAGQNSGGIGISSTTYGDVDVTILNTIIDNNGATFRRAGAMTIGTGSTVSLINCVIYGNKVGYFSYGPFSINGELHILNSIIWNNQGTIPQKLLSTLSSYSNIQGLNPMLFNNNIDSNPLFVDPKSGDFHLKRASPCVNSGHPNVEYLDNDGSRNDMGVYGGPYGDW